MPRQRRTALVAAVTTIVAAIAVDVLLSACDGSPTGPTPVQVVIAIGADGVSPQTASGARIRVEFVNQDSQPHDIRSDPHPQHADCPELNVGIIQPGERKVLPVISGMRTCGFHDDTRLDDGRFRGSITIQ